MSVFTTRLAQVLVLWGAVMMVNMPTAQANSQLDGLWRGELEIQQGISIVLGLNIKQGKLSLDSPNQGLWSHPVSESSLNEQQVDFTAKDLQATFTGEVKGEQIIGTFTQGKSRPLTLTRLNADDRQRLAYEGRYAGELVINGETTLPLQVNVAVVANDYVATLDSPAQQSFGIPLPEFTINDATLSFTAPMIKASYTSTLTDGEYQGKFLQGLERTLNLKKVAAGEEFATVPKAELGEHGGAVAVITPADVRYRYFAEHDASTQYEIGSVTKTMVAYLLAHAIAENQLKAADVVAEYIQQTPKSISFASLATHTSGLPRLPGDLFDQADANDPYAHYSQEQLLEQLSKTELEAPEYQYSNFGYGLLGEALAKVQQTQFTALMQEQIFAAFDMTHSFVAMDAHQAAPKRAIGHNLMGQAVPAWHFQALAGAGAVVSTSVDMVNYVQAMMTLAQQQDARAEVLFAPQFEMGGCCQQALGWLLQTDDSGNTFAWHNGQTAGFSSFVGFYLDGSRAVVVLNNQAMNLNEYAMKLLQGQASLDE